jgi:hypothetical protein
MSHIFSLGLPTHHFFQIEQTEAFDIFINRRLHNTINDADLELNQEDDCSPLFSFPEHYNVKVMIQNHAAPCIFQQEPMFLNQVSRSGDSINPEFFLNQVYN